MNRDGYLLPAATMILLVVVMIATLTHRLALSAYEASLYRYRAEQSHLVVQTFLHWGCSLVAAGAASQSITVSSIPGVESANGRIAIKESSETVRTVSVYCHTPCGASTGSARIEISKNGEGKNYEIVQWQYGS